MYPAMTKSLLSNFCALACDGDGTLTRAGHLGRRTDAALQRLKDAGRKLLLTTGEPTKDVKEFPHHEIFDLIVAENGAVLYDPANQREQLLCSPPPRRLLLALRKQHVHPLKR